MKIKNVIVILSMAVATVLISGCSYSSGPQIDQTAVSSIVKGKTTKAELIAKFGEPTSANSMNGREMLVWSFFNRSMSASNFIPGVGSLVGKSQQKGGTLYVTVDSNGVVESFNFMSGGYSR
jgi:outer membrane protein assembly factor BamE (lipoprotein component of BamABCDE complex)